MMRKIYLLCLTLLCCVAAMAQDFEIVSVESQPNDFAARDEIKTEPITNGRQCAVLRIATQNITPEQREQFTFQPDKGSYLVQRANRDGEIWLWVSPGLEHLRIKHRDLGQVELHMQDYRITIESLHTYKIVIRGTAQQPGPGPKPKVRQQYLAFQISPSSAVLEVNDRIWEVDADGFAQDFVDFGTYTYRVQAMNYHTDVGEVTVDDPDNTKLVPVTLRPNFGWIEVAGTGNLRDASVYVDNTLIGKAPCKSEALKSGEHTVRIVKRMYATYSGTVTVNDDETTRIAPELVADYAEVTLAVDADAEIWVNDEKKGVRSWTGRLGRGTYKMECRQASHEPSVISKEITPEMNGQTIRLSAPVPIYGSLNVESTPKLCKLFVDGQAMGETPKSINEILIGQHEIRLTKEGYADYTETVTIVRDERKQVKATLSNGQEIQFTCNVANARLSIDGNSVGTTSDSYLLTFGNHNLKATADGYQDYTETLNVTENSRRHSITMQAIHTAPVGAVEGLFSVSPNKQVYFSKGNLQYQASTKTWRFAEHQYDIIGNNNGGISSSYSGWIDLFGWGTSGYGNKYPYMTSTTSTDYGNGNNDIAGTQYDWGVHNAISNGGNQAGLWRTLTKDEWVYVFNTRSTTSGIRYAKACVNGMSGVILLPDDWSTSYYNLSNTNNSGAIFSSNTISASQWTTLEQHGAVFLPAAGYRSGTSVYDVGSGGYYWSASYGDSYNAYYVFFVVTNLDPQSGNGRSNGRPVRLVRSAQ